MINEGIIVGSDDDEGGSEFSNDEVDPEELKD